MRTHKNKALAHRVDEENYTFTAFTKTKTCKGCACSALMYCAGLQDGARHYIGNATAFQPITVNGRRGFAVCEMGFLVWEGEELENYGTIDDPKYPFPLEPCTKPSSRRYSAFRHTSDMNDARESFEDIAEKFLKKQLEAKQEEKRC